MGVSRPAMTRRLLLIALSLRKGTVPGSAFIHDGIGALTDNFLHMAGHTFKVGNSMKFQWYAVIHRKFLLFLFSRVQYIPEGSLLLHPVSGGRIG